MSDPSATCVQPTADRAPFWRRSIQFKQNCIIVAIATILLGALGLHDYLSARDAAMAALRDDAESMSTRLSRALVMPLWDMSRTQAEEFITSEMGERVSRAIMVRDDTGDLFAGRGRDASDQIVPITEEPTDSGDVLSTQGISKDGAKIGTVTVRLTTQPMEAALRQSAVAIVLRILLIDIALVLSLSLSLRRALIRPLASIQDFAHRVCEGDFGYRVEGRFTGELADLKGSIERMVAGMAEKMRQAQEQEAEARRQAEAARQAQLASDQAKQDAENRREELMRSAMRLQEMAQKVDSATRALSGRIEDVSRGAATQRSMAGETSQAMDDLNATVVEVARNASVTAKLADSTRATAGTGSSVVEQAVASIAEVKRESGALKSSMEELGRQVEGIGGIMSVISDIADQTNLLALNAAIEAARAGDAGRGFAVVADEVRKLAEKTVSATKEVEGVIRSISSGTKANIAISENAARMVGQAADLALDSGRALREIVELVGQTTDQIRSIADISERQSASSEQIKSAMSQVLAIANRTVEGMSHSHAALSDLEGLTVDLGEMVRRMQGR